MELFLYFRLLRNFWQKYKCSLTKFKQTLKLRVCLSFNAIIHFQSLNKILISLHFLI